MDKKDLKMYEAPVMETVELKLEGTMLTGSPTNAENVTSDPLVEE